MMNKFNSQSPDRGILQLKFYLSFVQNLCSLRALGFGVVLILLALLLLPSLAKTKEEPLKTDSMQVLFIKNFEANCESENNRKNIVWIGTSDGLFVVMDSKPQIIDGIKETHIKNIFYQGGKYWITSHNGLYYIEPNNLTKAQRIEGLQDKIIVSFYLIGEQNLIATDHRKKVYWVTLKDNKASPYEQLQNFSISQISDDICTDEECSTKASSKDNIWLIGSLTGGLFQINKNNAQQAFSINGLNQKVLIDLRQFQNNIWITTEKNGIYKASSVSTLEDMKEISGLENKRVTKLVDLGKYLLIGTMKDGAFYLPYNDILPRAYQISLLQGESVSNIVQSEKYAWVAGDFKGGLYRIDLSSLDQAVEVKPLRGKKILDILPFAGKVWLRVGQDELYGLDEEALDQIVQIHTLSNRAISKLKKIGTSLFFIETLKGAFVVNENEPDKVSAIHGLEDKKINAIYFKAGLIWTETYEHEIYVIEPDTPFNALPLKTLNGINIWSISQDSYGNYIVGSNKGAFYILRSTLKDGYLIPSTKDEGTTSILLLCGKVWIGSLNGYEVIDLSSLQEAASKAIR